MIQLDLTNPFTFKTSNDQELSGTFADLTIKQKTELETLTQKSIDLATIVNKLYKNITDNKKIILYLRGKDIQGFKLIRLIILAFRPILFVVINYFMYRNKKLSQKIRDISKENNPYQLQDEAIKLRFNMSLDGKDKDIILKIAEEIGYKPVFDVIQEAIKEGKQNA